jgi:ribosome-binding factor A
MLKVNSILREVLAEEVERLSDSRLDMVSITGVETAPDLRHAVVYIDVLGQGDTDGAIVALNKASRRLQSAIAAQVRMKYTPTLEFRVDPGVVGGERIEAILRSLERGQELDD